MSGLEHNLQSSRGFYPYNFGVSSSLPCKAYQ